MEQKNYIKEVDNFEKENQCCKDKILKLENEINEKCGCDKK